jgi:hypothetical protein
VNCDKKISDFNLLTILTKKYANYFQYKLYIIILKELKIKIFHMNNFWNNVLRYPRFFISSVAGLIIIILTPFKNLFKVRKLRFLLILSFLLFSAILYTILVNMVAL